MHPRLAIVIAFAATNAVVPLLFFAVLVLSSSDMPLPRLFMVAPLPAVYAFSALLGAISALPGFVLFRLVLSRLQIASPVAFALAGAMVGGIAAVLLCVPNHLWALQRYNLAAIGAAVGVLGGLLDCMIEKILIPPASLESGPQQGGQGA